MLDSAANGVRILIPLVNAGLAPSLVHLATQLAAGRACSVTLLSIVQIPEENALSDGLPLARAYRTMLNFIPSTAGDATLRIRNKVRVAREVWHGIMEAASEEKPDVLLLYWKGFSTSRPAAFGRTIDEILKSPPCDTVVAKPGELSGPLRVLLAARGGQYAELALAVAQALTTASSGSITVLHQGPASGMNGDEPFEALRARLERLPVFPRLVSPTEALETAILNEAKAHEVIIVGASAQPEGQSPLPSVINQLAGNDAKTLLIVRTRRPMDLSIYQRRTGRGNGGTHVSTDAERWFAENTFHAHEFKELSQLVARKRRQGLSISLAIIRGEAEETLASMIKAAHHALMENHPLVDEMVVVDCLRQRPPLARPCATVPLHRCEEVLPELDAVEGRGEALWKGLAATQGEIVVWLDGDLKNFHPRIVYGLVGPLLQSPEICYVNGFDQRPSVLESGAKVAASHAAAELVARPLLNLAYPELAAIIQPLSRVHAGRRSALERVPFFTGLGVEVGLLIDLYSKFGLSALGQVDLKEPIQYAGAGLSLAELSNVVVQVVLKRLGSRHGLSLLGDRCPGMKDLTLDERGYALTERTLENRERPPLLSVRCYREERQGRGQPVSALADEHAPLPQISNRR